MNVSRGYLQPVSKNTNPKARNGSIVSKRGNVEYPTATVEMTFTPSESGGSSPGSSSFAVRPSSKFPYGDFRNTPRQSILDLKADVMVNWLEQIQLEMLWSTGMPGEGVVLKKGRNDFTCAPKKLRSASTFFDQVVAMNVRCAMTINTRIIRIFLSRNTENYAPLGGGLRLQVLPSVEHLARCQKHHFGAFIADQKILVVWDDEPQNLMKRAENIEKSLVHVIWEGSDHVYDEKKTSPLVSSMELSEVTITPRELEEAPAAEDRPTMLMNPITVGLTLTFLIATLGLGWRQMAQQIAIDGKYSRLALITAIPCQIFASLFFFQVIIGNFAQIFGPVSQLICNSKFYSGKAPPRLDRNLTPLPHITIQMPVYKEGLTAVIKPTIISLKAAISTYELQGGTANIFVNDDGLQLLPQDEAQQRRDFYEEHNVGWVARPKHNPKPEADENAFIRRGKFKKASNMNYALMISNKVEDKLLLLERFQGWTQDHEYVAYEKCLAEVLHEEDGRAWAEGNIRVGDYILLIDSDTRVPADCLLDAGSEMEKSPEVGILQYSSGVMQVTDSFFENGVTFFTNLIYTAIRYGVANGDVSPFVGHNAILRWSALQEVSYKDEDGYDKFWSESHVSEDFDMSLRLQISGYIIRLAAYAADGFKEGVSITVYDEIARWEKYAFGCNELLFHPFRFWVTRGPFTPLFRKFLTSNIPVTSKITIMSYIGTYYAIGAAWILTLFNYFLIGWFNGELDHYYLDSFRVYFSLILVFSGLGNVALAILRYRLSEKSLLGALWENFKWVLFLSVFLGGISLHLSQALLSHFFEIEMSWEATSKEAENTPFFEEVPRLLKRFKFTFIFSIACTTLMIAGKFAFPWNWQIGTFQAIYPLASIVVSHFAVPIALNPALMMFTW
ncbi:hypothetical protein LCER1_G005121 [Lachnellula cervina]|uniref:Uncharacterized protein n=1 Tax=Lachnellula cervina TaxID=1316786 RepID=A0A7D8UTM0_9HELO|nr:hypothetical protein LCER1_G005121 [Lachnellula cervina]